MSDDYEIDDELICPACGHIPLHSRPCPELGCDDGWIDMHEYDDPLWYAPGEEEICQECQGTGLQRWCPSCGANYWIARALKHAWRKKLLQPFVQKSPILIKPAYFKDKRNAQ